MPNLDGFMLPSSLVRGSLRVRKNPSDKLEFQYNPETLNVQTGASWAKQRVPGVHNPRLQYSGGEGRELTFQLHLFSNTRQGMEVDSVISWLESLTYPDIGQQSLANREPPRCVLYLGENKVYPVVIDQVKVAHRDFYANLRTRHAVVDIQATEDRVKAVGYKDVRV